MDTTAGKTETALSWREGRTLLGRYLRPQRGKVGLLGLLMAGNLGLQLGNPLILRGFIDAAITGQPLETLVGGALLFLVVALATQAVAVTEAYVAEDVGWGATNRMRADLLAHLLGLDIAFHNKRTPGELIERVDGDVTALANFFSRFILLIAGNGLLMIGVLALLWHEDWRVGVAMSLFALITVSVLARVRNLGVDAATAERQATADMYGFVEERLAGLNDIRANGGTGYVMYRFHDRIRTLYTAGRRFAWFEAVMASTGASLFISGYLLALALGVWLYGLGAITLGTVYLFFAYADLLRRPIDQITDQLRDFQKAGAGMTRVQQLYTLHPTILPPAPAEAASLPPGPPSVEFDAVDFGYGDTALILREVSFRVEPGQVLGVVGRTGSGKTTLSRLILRLYDPAAGTIRLGDVDVRQLPPARLRAAVGVVTQDVQLFQASVRDNLTLFDPGIPDREILATLHDLGLDGWFARLPQGLDSELESGGGGLSAGQAQLLAFARVFLRNPDLVILDEASSRLDPATERLIEQAVDRLLAGRTAIIIAHRLGTVQRADRILVMDHGQVREQGDRIALAADPDSQFAALLRAGLDTLDPDQAPDQAPVEDVEEAA